MKVSAKHCAVWFLILPLISGSIFAGSSPDKGKILSLELSGGGALMNFQDLMSKNDFLEGERNDYLALYQSVNWTPDSLAVSGDLKKIKYMFPLNLCLNIKIFGNFWIKVGGEYSFGGQESEKTMLLTDPDNNLTHTLSTEYETSYIMPYLGLEWKKKWIALFLKGGMTFVRFNCREYYNLVNAGTGIFYTREEEYSDEGTGWAAGIGGKFHFYKNAFIGLEYIYSKSGHLSGEKRWKNSSWNAGLQEGSRNGDFYSGEFKFPNSEEWVKNWDIFQTPPTLGMVWRNLEKMKPDFSSVRVFIGVRF
jgi:opacity protein-like surface antigen